MNHSEQYVQAAYEYGLIKAAEEAGMDKEAFIPVGALAGLARGIGTFGKSLWTPAKALFNAAEAPLANAWGGVGRLARGGLNKVMSPNVAKHVNPFLDIAGKDMARDAANFGLFGGLIGAATADEGQRLKGFGTGLLAGGLGGVGWTGTKNLMSKGLTSGLKTYGGAKGTRAADWLTRYSGKEAPIFGKGPAGWTMQDRMKALGGKAIMSAVPTVGAFYASDLLTPNFEEAPAAEPPATPEPQGWKQQARGYASSPYFRAGTMGAFGGSSSGAWY